MSIPKSLKEYKKKRNFKQTAEPSGDHTSRKEKNLFVLQQHDASNLHYDFRIRIGDVLKSWAVPKGPSTNHKDRRLAIETEDHPVDYADFEGVIPEGEYGAGTVLIWDRGTYKNLREEKDDDMNMEDAYKDGKIEIWLEGKKLKGGYA
ncbi:MAG: DNA polymerase ligase N-terminal domain-containing protein, partial [Bacteroidota bacterium]